MGGRGALVLEEDEGAVAVEGLAGTAQNEVLGALDVDLEQVDAAVDRGIEVLEADLDRLGLVGAVADRAQAAARRQAAVDDELGVAAGVRQRGAADVDRGELV